MLSRVSLLLLLVAAVANGRPFGVTPSSLTRQSCGNSTLSNNAIKFRGGASSVAADEDEAIDLDESDEEVSDDEDEAEAPTKKMGTKLATSTVKAADKSKSKKVSRAKSAVNEGLAEIPKKSSKKKKSRKFALPYIVRVCMNPFTVLAMTKAYFASLFNLDYIKKVRVLLLTGSLQGAILIHYVCSFLFI